MTYALLYYPDFYINYSQGFVKRGLDGTMIEWLSLFLNISSVKLIKVYKIFILAILMFFVLRSIKKWSLISVIIISLMMYFLHFFDHFIFLKKDILLLELYLLAFYFFEKDKDILALIVMLVACLIHEVFYLFSIIPIVFYLYKFKKRNFKKILFIFILATTTFILVSFIFRGSNINTIKMIASFANNSPEFYESMPNKYNTGTFIFDSKNYIWNSITGVRGYVFFLYIIIINYMFMFVFIKSFFSINIFNFVFSILNIQTVLAVSLCIIACDISRWLLLFNFSIFCLSFFIEDDKRLIIRENKYINKLLFLMFFIGSSLHTVDLNTDSYMQNTAIGHLIKLF